MVFVITKDVLTAGITVNVITRHIGLRHNVFSYGCQGALWNSQFQLSYYTINLTLDTSLI